MSPPQAGAEFTDSPSTTATPPGAYPGSAPGEIRYWNGMNWDPRPVATTWTRVWCWIIDNILASIAAFALAVVLSLPFSLTLGSESAATVIANFIGIIAGFTSYFALGYATWGRTPGMMLGKLDVVSIETGTPLTWGPAYLRALVLSLGQLCGILAIVWLIITASSRTKQGPHDSAAHSLVLRRV